MGTSTKLTFGALQLPSAVAQAAQQILDRIENDNDNEDLIHELANLGRLREGALKDHRATGAVFTPYSIAQELADLLAVGPGEVVCDPSVGSGVFLLAVAEQKFQRGESIPSIAETLRGIDIDLSLIHI